MPAAKKKTLTVWKKSQISLPMTLIDSPETVSALYHQLTSSLHVTIQRKNQVSLGHKIPGSKRFKYNICTCSPYV